MLFGDRGKLIAMLIGVSFAALIMTQQPSIFVGLLTRTYSFVDEIGLPDIWVMDPGVQFALEHKPLRDTDLGAVRGISGVEWAVPLYKGLIRLRLPDGNTKTADLTGLDDATLIGAPSQIFGAKLPDIQQSDAIFVDREGARTLLKVTNPDGTTRPLAIGDEIEINDKRAVVKGYIKLVRSFVIQPQIYTTYSRAVTYSPQDRRQLTYILVKAKPGADQREICRKISNYTGLAAYTGNDFRNVNLIYWLKNTGIPINFGISVLLGFLVGAAVVGQTFYSFVYENLRHYAALKAMGLKNKILSRMVMLQALVVGFIGYGIGVGLASFFGMKVQGSVLAFRMPPSLLLFSGTGVLLIILVAAFLGIRRVVKVDPSIVFRG